MSVAVGKRFPLHAGSSSKAFLAFLPAHEQDHYLDSHELTALTGETITDLDALRQELEHIRQTGYAISFGERQAGAGSIAAPVFDGQGLPRAVISVCGPLERFREEVHETAPLLLDHTATLSRQLGYRG